MLARLARLAEPLAGLSDWPDRDTLDALLAPARPRSRRGHPIHLVAPHTGGGQRDYERRILEEGALATRQRNWHDLFNVLAWRAFPVSKAALNARHCAARRGEGQVRTPEQDALTLFDESGVIFASADARFTQRLRDFRWCELFIERRGEFRRSVTCVLFGHGLAELALHPFIGLMGKAFLVDMQVPENAGADPAWLAALDARVAGLVDDPSRLASPRELAPLPVLGVPGWWPANEHPAFYEQPDYFRTARRTG